MSKGTVIIGNGASLRDFDFTKLNREKYNVVGCCLAFRHWVEIDWYPDLYINADDVVIQNPEVIDFIKMKKCKQYLVSHKLKDAWTEYPKDGSILFLQDLMMVPQSTFKYVRNWCSGSSCLITAFDISVDIHILGMDCNYVEMIPECEELEDGTLKITKTPESNPNYFFDDYQRVGDIYNKPNGTTIHKRSWFEGRLIMEFLQQMYPECKPRVTNYSLKEVSSIREFFDTKELADFKFDGMVE